ncbi:MAG TPA: hypothetical protein VEQ59_13910 [Polyangiaceae bacterium]|nr:hypothetical protein [Polyangiaceae bacterium]
MSERRDWLRLCVGLLCAPAVVTLALFAAPLVALRPQLADLASFSGAASVALMSLVIAVPAKVPMRVALGAAVLTGAALGALAVFQASLGAGATLVAVDTVLVVLAWALGGSLGKSVQHQAHLFPACVVAASADVVSLLSPEGPSHAVAASERALSVLAIWFPVPGTRESSPALGVGDLVFIAFVLGVAVAHQLDYKRAIACCVAGVVLAGFAAAALGVAVPALVPIAAATIIGLPSIRKLRRADRRAAHVSMLVAGSIAVATIARTAARF